ncbi:MAG TPA: dienelactone hydrolase family protein [Sphingomonas sp.]
MILAQEQVSIHGKDGAFNTHVLTPSGQGSGPWPAAIFYMDGLAIRPTLIEMAQQLADAGYVVLLPDLFYRYDPYGTFVPREVFKGDFRTIIGPLMATTDNLKAADDTAAMLSYLDTRSDVAGPRIGTVGFCMGGGMAITAAGAFPDRIAAAASFHGGNLATDLPVSPHLLAPGIKGEIYVAAADKDHSYPPEMAARLEKAFDEAGVNYAAETYEGAAHGWMKPDFPIYDQAAAERGWKELLALFARNLK